MEAGVEEAVEAGVEEVVEAGVEEVVEAAGVEDVKEPGGEVVKEPGGEVVDVVKRGPGVPVVSHHHPGLHRAGPLQVEGHFSTL